MMSVWYSNGQQLHQPQTSSVAGDGGQHDEFGKTGWRLTTQTAVKHYACLVLDMQCNG